MVNKKTPVIYGGCFLVYLLYMEFIYSEFFGLLAILFGFIVGLGAVTVIDIHGFLGRTSSYWTVATTRTHKVTKPLIWIGTLSSLVGAYFWYVPENGFNDTFQIHLLVSIILILNGLFLSFVVSPFLIQKEKKGRDKELLPTSIQIKILASFLVSFVGWWFLVFLFAYTTYEGYIAIFIE